MKFGLAALAVPLCLLAAPALAQDAMVSASNPAGIAQAMRDAGYTADVGLDSVGDPQIKTKLGNWSTTILFYGCSGGKNCDSVQFSTGFDRKRPMKPADALAVALQYRYAALSLDNEGDPYLRWDIITEGGISKNVFLSSLRRYSSILDQASEKIFAGE